MNIKIGDWVRFYRNGQLVIGQVEYIGSRTLSGRVSIATDAGEVDAESVREVRSKEQP